MPTPTATPGTDFGNSSAACYVEHPWSLLDACVNPQLAGATGGSDALFGLMLGMSILVPMWLADDEGRLAAPAVLLILLGGSLLPMLPGNMRGAAWTLIILGVAAAIAVVANRFVLNPGVRP
jgi:hypothetical protein